MLNKEILEKLKNPRTLEKTDTTFGFVSTGCLALNKIISGNYHDGIPIGAITQLRGDSSTGKTLFLTSILIEAQKCGYFTKLLDAENAYNELFAKMLGLDPKSLLYSNPESLEEAFADIESTIESIREHDSDTPIVIGIDSLAVLGTRKELATENFEHSPADGAIRAQVTGMCFRRINPVLRKHKVALVVINQIRSKIGVMYGSPDTNAAGGKSLEYYLGVDLKTFRREKLKDDNDNPKGIRGEVECTKNKYSIPYKKCEFELVFNTGLSRYHGLLEDLCTEGLISKSSNGRCQLGETKFTAKDFINLIYDKNNKDFDIIRLRIGFDNQKEVK
jgi:recombination protein RecA